MTFAQSRVVSDVMSLGMAVRAIQAAQHASTIPLLLSQTLWLSKLPRSYFQTFSTTPNR